VDVSDTDDAGLLRQVRHAEATLDERPAPRVRQAVLLAASQAAGAGLDRASMTAAPPARAGPARPGWSWWPRTWNWSVPVVATMLVGAIAVGIVTEVQRAAQPAAPAVLASATPEVQKTPAPEAMAPSRREAAAAPPEPIASARPDVAAGAPVAAAAKRAAGAPQPATRPASPLAESSNAPPVTPTAAPAASAASSEQARFRQEPSETDTLPAKRVQNKVIDSSARRDTASATAGQMTLQVQAPVSAAPRAHAEPETPQHWVDRIVALRHAGRQDEADRELALLRKRFPQFAVPAAALRPPG
jgi:hypothetical protein